MFHDYSQLEQAGKFVLKYHQPLYQVELAENITRAYIYQQEPDKAKEFYRQFILVFNPRDDKDAKNLLSQMKKTVASN